MTINVVISQSFYLRQVHINLGAGESEISSGREHRLDDLQWHEVKIVRTEADLRLIVDQKYTSR